MIESGILPIGRRVTRATVRAEATAVFIIVHVAGVTISRRAFIHTILMTVFASNLSMFPFQFERRQIVIKLRGLPSLGRVARATVRAEAAKMRIILLMTREAILRRRSEICHGSRVDMTRDTVHLRMFTIQTEWKRFVRKCFSKTVHAVVTGKTLLAVIDGMCLYENRIDLLMTGLTVERIKCREALRVTIRTCKRLARDPLLVTA